MNENDQQIPSLFGPDVAADPYPSYARLRKSHPVCPVTLPNGLEEWLITRHEDAQAAFVHPQLVKNPESARDRLREAGEFFFSDEFDRFNAHMLNADPPEHARLRRPVSKAFTMRQVERHRSRIEQVADELLDKMAGLDECDLLTEYAYPLPLPIICSMMGVPEEDGERLNEWAAGLFARPDSGMPLTQTEAAACLGDYVTALVETKREAMAAGGEPSEDLISQVVRAPNLSEQELLSTVLMVLLTGQTSTAEQIGNAVVTLLRHPDQLQLLIDRPDLIDSAVNELLRYESSIFRATMRFATENVEIGRTTVPRGAIVGIVIGAANRDPVRFPDADRLDLTRSDSTHLSFGQGVHYCLGAPLARLVIGIALTRLFTRFPRLQAALPLDELPWQDPDTGIGRSLARLPVRLDSR